jgi:hypothetical protein
VPIRTKVIMHIALGHEKRLKDFSSVCAFLLFLAYKEEKIKKIKCHMVRPKLYWKTLDLAVNIPQIKTA